MTIDLKFLSQSLVYASQFAAAVLVVLGVVALVRR